MRSVLYLVLTLAGVAGIAALFRGRGCCRQKNPTREAERLLDQARNALEGIEKAIGNLQGPETSAS